LEHIKHILNILRETRGFDPMQLVPQLTQLLVNPGVQRLGQQVTNRLAQKAVAHLLRELLAAEEVNNTQDRKLDRTASLSLSTKI
jgi:hypothetical protein